MGGHILFIIMLSRGKTRRRSTRANLMVVVGSALYFLIMTLTLYVMDRQVYSAEKLEIIRNNFLEIFNLPDTVNDQARRALYAMPEYRREQERMELEETLQSIVDGPTSIYQMWLADENGNVVMEVVNEGKQGRYNSWSNNLFIREFSGRTSQNVTPVRTSGQEGVRTAGHLVGIYTSPVDVPAIEALTKRYRVYAAILILLWVLSWLAIYYYLLRPVRNVTLQLDRIQGEVPTLITGARGDLEKGYNELAASALLQRIEDTLNAAARAGDNSLKRGDAFRTALSLTGEGFGAEWMRVAFLGSGENATEVYEWADPSVRGSLDQIRAGIAPPHTVAELHESYFRFYEDQSGFTWHGSLAMGCLQVDCRYNRGRLPDEAFQSYLVRACESLRAGFVAFEAYREQLFRERSEANISLSRNMGHDLTNIIATSKLELMGVRRVLTGLAEGQALSGPRAAILSESVNGLLESTRFMQEMVNIYRSFSYIKRPAYERRNLAPLIEDFLQLFEPSLSSHVSIVRELDEKIPAPIVEPRLLKLALFNVLQNAVDSVKRNDTPEVGTLEVRLTYEAETELFCITVVDNGPGIRDGEGRLLSQDEVAVIFDYGYTTKGVGGEGLGMNWVQTIMTEFHDGGVRAENNADKGASVALCLRSMEHKEARVSDIGEGRNEVAIPGESVSRL